jgi:hypothetical protein
VKVVTFDDARNVTIWSAEDENTTWMFYLHCCFWQVHVHSMMGNGGTGFKDGESLELFNSLVNHVTRISCESFFPFAPVGRRRCE